MSYFLIVLNWEGNQEMLFIGFNIKKQKLERRENTEGCKCQYSLDSSVILNLEMSITSHDFCYSGGCQDAEIVFLFLKLHPA